MSRIAKPLTDTEIKKSKYTSKEEFEILKKVNPNIQRKNKLSDGNGLFLIIRETGTKMWQFDFKFLDKRYSMSFGIYPDVSLKDARDIREKALQNIKKGINPIESKKSNFQIDNTFKHIAEKWLLNMKDGWSESNFKKIKSNFENNAFPFIGSKDIKQITRRDILKLIEQMEKRNATEYANRLLNNIQRMYKYAITNEYIEHNIISDIDKSNALKKQQKKNIPAITKKNEIKQLLIDINNYGETFFSDLSTINALKISPYVALRPYNIRFLEWDEIDFEQELLIIPADKMKMKIDFVLPLSRQVILLLKNIYKYKNSKYIFPSASSTSKPISENTLNHALHRMGYKDRHTSHGFRAMFSTNAHELRNEHKINSDVIESCLAHSKQNSVKAAYNRQSKFKYLDEKRILMQWWANWLDSINNKI